MNHDLIIKGYAFSLRPVSNSDAAKIIELRTTNTRCQYLNTTSANVANQIDWLENYYKRPQEYYFAIERITTNAVEGFISIYNYDEHSRTAEWGRWVLSPGSQSAVESAWLIYRCAFDTLRLSSIYCRTIADNTAVVSFHDSCGIRNRRLLKNHLFINEAIRDAVEHCLPAEDWPAIRETLGKISSRIACKL